jgi:deoxyhypusine synthase
LYASELQGLKLRINPSIDVNETAAIVLNSKKMNGKSAVLLIGGGSPKNFVLQTEPHIQEILLIKEFGHDYFIQITDARPDTGGLSGATPHEAVSWGKISAKAKRIMIEGDGADGKEENIWADKQSQVKMQLPDAEIKASVSNSAI